MGQTRCYFVTMTNKGIYDRLSENIMYIYIGLFSMILILTRYHFITTKQY